MSRIRRCICRGKSVYRVLNGRRSHRGKDSRNTFWQMEEAGADLIEIGIPFSDPTAEGIVIQEADIRALEAGT